MEEMKVVFMKDFSKKSMGIEPVRTTVPKTKIEAMLKWIEICEHFKKESGIDLSNVPLQRVAKQIESNGKSGWKSGKLPIAIIAYAYAMTKQYGLITETKDSIQTFLAENHIIHLKHDLPMNVKDDKWELHPDKIKHFANPSDTLKMLTDLQYRISLYGETLKPHGNITIDENEIRNHQFAYSYLNKRVYMIKLECEKLSVMDELKQSGHFYQKGFSDSEYEAVQKNVLNHLQPKNTIRLMADTLEIMNGIKNKSDLGSVYDINLQPIVSHLLEQKRIHEEFKQLANEAKENEKPTFETEIQLEHIGLPLTLKISCNQSLFEVELSFDGTEKGIPITAFAKYTRERNGIEKEAFVPPAPSSRLIKTFKQQASLPTDFVPVKTLSPSFGLGISQRFRKTNQIEQ